MVWSWTDYNTIAWFGTKRDISFAPSGNVFGHGTKYNTMVLTRLPDVITWFGPRPNVLLCSDVGYHF